MTDDAGLKLILTLAVAISGYFGKGVVETVSKTDMRVSELVTMQKVNAHRMDTINEGIKDIKSEIITIKSDLVSVKKSVEDLSGRISNLERRVDKLEEITSERRGRP